MPEGYYDEWFSENRWEEQKCRLCKEVVRVSSDVHRPNCIEEARQANEIEGAIEAQRGEVSPSMPELSLPAAHTEASLQALIQERRSGGGTLVPLSQLAMDIPKGTRCGLPELDQELQMIEPFKRQVSWAIPMIQADFSCGICGQESSASFCVNCQLTQRRIDLEGLLQQTKGILTQCVVQIRLIEAQIESNKIAAAGLVVVHAKSAE